MNLYDAPSLFSRIEGNSYVGRGIVAGCTPDGSRAVAAYFIMGRSENSRNRVFLPDGQDIVIHPYDAAKVEDPSLIIYSPVRVLDKWLIVTNGDQTDTVYDGLKAGLTFSQALQSRSFEPDAPNFTPRISALLQLAPDGFTYQMSILKSADSVGSACCRFTFDYPALPGIGHFLHTYVCDGNPLPTFQGEPERVAIPDDTDAWADTLWNTLDAQNRIALAVRTVCLRTGESATKIINKFR